MLYFAGASSYTGKDHEAWPAPLPLTELFSKLDSRYPGMQQKILDSCMVTINLDYVKIPEVGDPDNTMIQECDEVAIIPPVSSG